MYCPRYFAASTVYAHLDLSAWLRIKIGVEGLLMAVPDN